MKALLLKQIALLIPVALAALGLSASQARAGSTDPTLAIGQLWVAPAGPASIAEVSGVFGFDDVIQVDYQINLVVYQGDAFTRFPAGGQAVSGSFVGLSDGLDSTEVAALEATGQAEANGEILLIEPNRIQVSLPASFADGIVTAVLYVSVVGEGTFTSNTVSTVLAGVAGGGS